MAQRSDLTAKQDALIAALLTHATIGEAAKAAGVAHRTAFRWMQDPDFQREYRAGRRQVVEHALGLVQKGTGAAVATLLRNLTAKSPAVQVSAAKALLEYGVRAVEVDDLTERLELIEAMLAEGDGKSAHGQSFYRAS